MEKVTLVNTTFCCGGPGESGHAALKTPTNNPENPQGFWLWRDKPAAPAGPAQRDVFTGTHQSESSKPHFPAWAEAPSRTQTKSLSVTCERTHVGILFTELFARPHKTRPGEGSRRGHGLLQLLYWICEFIWYENSHTHSWKRGNRGGKPPTEPETS